MPTGSYLIREFAKHVVRIRIHNGHRVPEIARLDKNTWQVVQAKETYRSSGFTPVRFAMRASICGPISSLS